MPYYHAVWSPKPVVFIRRGPQLCHEEMGQAPVTLEEGSGPPLSASIVIPRAQGHSMPR